MSDNDSGLRYWTNRRVTRRRALGTAVVGAGALAAIGLVGCSGGDGGDGGGNGNPDGDPTNTPQDGTQDGPGKPGGILRVRQANALPSMNPFGAGIFALAQGLTLGFTVFDHMWYVPTDTGEVIPFLATNIEQPDDLTVIATLGDAVFHDKEPANGRAVTAQDVAASYKRFRAETPFGYSWLHDVMKDIVATDDKTVTITQNFPWAWVFTSSNAGSPITSSIMPEEILTGHDDLLLKDAVGSSHWILDSHDNGSNIKFRKFDKFRVAGQPLLDGVDFRLITDANAAHAAFLAKEIDTFGFASKDQADDTLSELGDEIAVSSDLSRDYYNLMMKFEPPFTDIRVRKAFNLLIDRDEIILIMEDGNGKKTGPIPPAHVRYALPEDDADLKEFFRHDIAEAKQLLDAAGFDFDDEIELKHSTRPGDSQVSEILQAQLARGGVKIKLVPEDLVKWFSQTLNQSQFRLTAFQHLPYEDPDLPLRFYLGPEGDRKANFMNYKEPKVDAAVLAAAQELDEEARVEKVREAQRVIMKEYAPMLNLHSKINYGGRYSYVKGTIGGRGSLGLFNRTTWLDKA